MPSVLDGLTPATEQEPVLQSSPTELAPAPSLPSLQYRNFGDAAATREGIFNNVLRAAQAMEPVTNQRHTLELADVGYEGPESYSKAQWKHALLTRGTLSRKLRGRWILKDSASGQPIAERRTTLANVPWMTDHGSFIQNGTEYLLAHQLRLQPGVYTRRKANGELEAHVNVMPGKGRSHRLHLDPESGIFKLQVGQASMPLLPLLRAMGVKDDQLRQAWGDQLTADNISRGVDPRVMQKLYERVAKKLPDRPDSAAMDAAVVEAFTKMELDPSVTKRTLKGDFGKVDANMILAATKKLVALNRGTEEPDNRDDPAYQTLLGPEDHLAERLAKDKGSLRQLLWKASARGTLDHVQPGVFNKAIQAAIMTSGLGSPTEEINPGEIFDHQTRVTRMGEGGITSMEAVPDSSRNVQPGQLGFIDFLRTPESGKVGVDMRLARAARKGSDGRLYAPVKDVRTGEIVYRSPQDLANAPLVFPGALKSGAPGVRAIVNGRLRYVRPKSVRYELPTMEDTFSPLGNLVPLKSLVKGQRAVMASRMLTQALPLVDGEAPLVQSGMPGVPDRSYEEEYATHMGAVKAEQDATVLAANDTEITLRHRDGTTRTVELYHNFPFNRKTAWHQTATVRPGDAVKAGQLLARSNFTDPNGVTALGKNLSVAYIPFRGMNFEDAVVISQSAARRLTSEHIYQNDAEWTNPAHKGLKAFQSVFPGAYDRKVLANFTDDGVIKQGTEVKYGDPLVLVVDERERTHGQIHRGRKSSFNNGTVTWDHHSPGIVTDVAVTPKGAMVVVKAKSQMEVGDKLSGRYGDKGVVADIIPDDQMPTNPQGKPFELLLNPLGIPSRTNPAQLIEAALGKIALKTGKPYKVQDFDDAKDYREWAEQELRKHNVQAEEDLHDPETGRKIPGIMTGSRFFMKLHHTSESKGQGRSFGAYTAEGEPAKGGETGSKRVGMLDLGALLSHGATQVIRDVKLVRGQADPRYWQQFMSGYKPPTPKVPVIYEKFVNQLRAAGVNPVREGDKTHIMALQDSDIDLLSGDRELQNADTVDWKDGMKPKKGGLFDERLTGGHHGRQWAKITLHEPMPSPVMEEPIRRVLGLTENKFRDVLAGREQLGGISGPTAIHQALENIDLTKAIAHCRSEISSGKKTARDAAVRKFGYLLDAQRLGVHPKSWMLTKVPVLPPSWRPVSTMGNKKLPMVADANYLYKELFDANKNLRELSSLVEDVGDERLAVYDAFKGVTGLGDPLQPKNQERRVKGVLRQIFGSSPKMGVIQHRLLGSTVDLVGRAVVTPDPDFDMDHVGIPEDKAWEIYKPFVVRHLVRRGTPRMMAARMAKDRQPAARQALLTEMESRPVIVNRAPVLHKYGMMAFYPKLTKGHTVRVSPLVVGGFNMDFDGDAVQYHVPSTDEAASEAAEKMLPSKNLFSVSTFKPMYKPSQEYALGLYTASVRVDKKKPPRTFATTADAMRAYHRGDISVDSQVTILNP